MSAPDGGPAFPYEEGANTKKGMSLRAWLAGQALSGTAGILGIPHAPGWTPEDIAARAVAIADAVIAKLGTT